MARVEGEIVIRRPVDEVFDFVADERNEPRYNPKMRGVELVTANLSVTAAGSVRSSGRRGGRCR